MKALLKTLKSMNFCKLVSLLLFLAPLHLLAETSPDVTFSKDIAPLIFNNCTECHRPNTAAPFNLMSFKDVFKRAKTILNVIEEKYMPPWHPVKGHGSFQDERGLSKEQIGLFSKWIDLGKPLGNESEIPSLPTYADGWELGEPDLIVKMPRGYQVKADGRDIYRNFTIPLALKEDKWIKAISIQPSARAVVHHCLYFYDTSGTGRKLDGIDGIPGFKDGKIKKKVSLGGWAVGAESKKLPKDYSILLPKGADLILSTHFHPSGKPETEQTTIGLYFSDQPSSRQVTELQVPGFFGRLSGLNIPAGESNYLLKGTLTLPMDVEILTASAHMHYLGTSAKGWATLPNGEVKDLLYIDEWDFNWQGQYYYKTPLFLPKGTFIETEITYDNSENNPFNPFHPPRNVKWGLQSEDEMGSLIYNIIPHHEKDNPHIEKAIQASIYQGSITYDYMIERLDKNKNGSLQISEFPKKFKKQLVKNDLNKNGTLEKNEIKRIQPRLNNALSKLL